jgi:hypothetical protein
MAMHHLVQVQVQVQVQELRDVLEVHHQHPCLHPHQYLQDCLRLLLPRLQTHPHLPCSVG